MLEFEHAPRFHVLQHFAQDLFMQIDLLDHRRPFFINNDPVDAGPDFTGVLMRVQSIVKFVVDAQNTLRSMASVLSIRLSVASLACG